MSAEPRTGELAVPHSPSRGSLLAILGVAFGIAAGVGGAIGGGILRTPGVVASHLPSADWMIGLWAFGTVYCLVTGNVLIELATMMPRAGGPYVFIRRAFGEFWGFVFGWADWLLQTSGLGFLALAFGEYAVRFWPQFPVGAVPIATATIIVFTALNMAGLRLGSGLQQALSLIKVVCFVAVIVVCLMAPAAAPVPATQDAPALHGLAGLALLTTFFVSWQLVQETYSGYEDAIYFSEENRDSARSLPRAVLFSILVISAIYLSIIVAITHVLTPAQIAGSKLAIADAASAVLGAQAGRWVTALSLVTLLSILNISVLLAPRILYAIGRNGLFVERAVTVNAGGTPSVAMLITSAVGILLVMTGSFELLFTITAFLGVTITIGNAASLFLLRRREPDANRPYRALGYPWLPAFAFVLAGSLWLGSLYANPRSALWGLGLVTIAYPAYRYALRRRESR